LLSILLGTLIGGWLVTADQGPLYVGALAVGFALTGWLSSRQIPECALSVGRQRRIMIK